jgi:hypothetical protein
VIHSSSWVVLSMLLGAILPACSDNHASHKGGLPQVDSGSGGSADAAIGGAGGGSAVATGGAGNAGNAGTGSADFGGRAGEAGTKGSTGGTSGAGTGGGVAAAPIACSGSVDAPTAPVVVAARITCSGSSDVLTVAAGAGNSGWAAERAFDAGSGTFASFFFHVTDSAVTVERFGADTLFPLVTSDSAGVPAVAATKKASLDWLSRPANATSGWAATSAATPADPSTQVGDLAIAADGTQYLLARLFSGVNSETVELETRSSGATDFKHTTVVTMPWQSALSVDAAGGPHVWYWLSGQGLFDWQPGGGPALSILPATNVSAGATPPLHRSRASGGGPVAIAVGLPDSVHVARQRADATFDDIKLPDSAPTPYGLGSPVPCQTAACPPVRQVGEYQRGLALAQTADGSQWIVQVRDHIDRDITYAVGGEMCMCVPMLEPQNDRSSAALVVRRLAPNSLTPSAILWSLDLGATSSSSPGSMLDAAAAGSLLHILIDGASNQNPSLVRYLIVDTAMLH